VSDLLQRLQRDTVIWLAVMVAAAVAIRPAAPRFALGIAGGGVLMGLAYWAIRGLVDQVAERAIQGENRNNSRAFALVKFFTRHAILAVAGYVMMTRLALEPLGLLIGVSAPAGAAALEAARAIGRPRTGRRGRETPRK